MPVTLSDYLVINQGGTPGTAGTGAYFVASIADVFNPALSQAASADPATLTAYEGSIIWWAGEPYIWNGAAYEPVRMATLDPRLQAGTVAPTTRGDASALADGDLWYDTTADALKVYETGAWTAVSGGSVPSSMVDNGDNTITHTAGDGTTFTMMKAPTHYTAPAAPGTPYVGDTWYDTTNSKLFLRTNDGTNDIWQDITGGGTSSTVLPFDWQSYNGDPVGNVTTRADGTPLVDGDQCWDDTNDILYGWDGAAWVAIGPSGASSAVAMPTGIGGSRNRFGSTGSAFPYTVTEAGVAMLVAQQGGANDGGNWDTHIVYVDVAVGDVISFNVGASTTEVRINGAAAAVATENAAAGLLTGHRIRTTNSASQTVVEASGSYLRRYYDNLANNAPGGADYGAHFVLFK